MADPHSGITCRQMTAADLDDCLALAAGAGWNQRREDWLLFLEFEPDACFVAETEGRLVATTTAIRYGTRFAWIGMVLVHPDLRRRGIGTLLLNAALEALAACETIRLDATPAGLHVYARLGFVEECALGRQIAPRATWPPWPDEPPAVTPVTAGDLDEISAFDAPIFGADRRRVLQAWYERTPAAAFQLRRNGRLAGYALGRLGAHFATIGPVIAANEADARHLTTAVGRSFGAVPVGIDSPGRHAAFRAWLERCGFVFQRPLTRMYRGPNRWPGLPEQQWGILGPEIG
jgi:GNAT superfamily N-acetyltransferase